MRFPFDGQYEFDYEEEYESYRGMSPKMMALFMEDEINRESKVAPDTTGADKYFIDGFITEEIDLIPKQEAAGGHRKRLKNRMKGGKEEK